MNVSLYWSTCITHVSYNINCALSLPFSWVCLKFLYFRTKRTVRTETKFVFNSGGCQSFEVNGIFRVSRSGEADRFESCGVPGNHRLLWHGTNTVNMIGILKQGLRIAPPEASRSGWSLGKVCK